VQRRRVKNEKYDSQDYGSQHRKRECGSQGLFLRCFSRQRWQFCRKPQPCAINIATILIVVVEKLTLWTAFHGCAPQIDLVGARLLGGSVIRSLTDAGRQGKGSVAREVKSLQIGQISQKNPIFALPSPSHWYPVCRMALIEKRTLCFGLCALSSDAKGPLAS
jgi:hypothetical protein